MNNVYILMSMETGADRNNATPVFEFGYFTDHNEAGEVAYRFTTPVEKLFVKTLHCGQVG